MNYNAEQSNVSHSNPEGSAVASDEASQRGIFFCEPILQRVLSKNY